MIKKIIRIIIGIAIGAFLLWILFRKTDWHIVYYSIYSASIGWLILGQICAWAGYFTRIQRWTYVVRASDTASFRSMLSATQIGFLMNFIIPMRIGEVTRAYVLSRLTKISFSKSFAMVGLDRVNDIIALLFIVIIAVFSFPVGKDIEILPHTFNNINKIVISSDFIRALAISISLLLSIIVIILVLLYVKQSLILRIVDMSLGRLSKYFAKLLQNLFLDFAAGMHIFRSGKEIAKSTIFSIFTWMLGVLSIAAMIKAFNINYPWFMPFLMLAMIAASISVPVTPGTVGQYHIPIIACLIFINPSIGPDKAKAVAIVIHILHLVPITVLGIFCLFREKLRFSDLIWYNFK
ncbi:MAG: lysylphosphatidylglycerol synthase transmembrane domain-containing protein [bacterium]